MREREAKTATTQMGRLGAEDPPIRRQHVAQPSIRQSRLGRLAPLARLALRIGGRYVARSPQLLFASVERRTELRHDLALRSAEEVAEELGYMKGVLMKLGQMASYVDEDMPATFRAAMGRL